MVTWNWEPPKRHSARWTPVDYKEFMHAYQLVKAADIEDKEEYEKAMALMIAHPRLKQLWSEFLDFIAHYQKEFHIREAAWLSTHPQRIIAEISPAKDTVSFSKPFEKDTVKEKRLGNLRFGGSAAGIRHGGSPCPSMVPLWGGSPRFPSAWSSP